MKGNESPVVMEAFPNEMHRNHHFPCLLFFSLPCFLVVIVLNISGAVRAVLGKMMSGNVALWGLAAEACLGSPAALALVCGWRGGGVC